MNILNPFNFARRRRDNELFVILKYGTSTNMENIDSIDAWLDTLPDEVIRNTHHRLNRLDIIIGKPVGIIQSKVMISLFVGHEGFAPKILQCIRKSLIEYENS